MTHRYNFDFAIFHTSWITYKYEICIHQANISHDVSKVFKCHLVGRYVRLQLHVDNCLNICYDVRKIWSTYLKL